MVSLPGSDGKDAYVRSVSDGCQKGVRRVPEGCQKGARRVPEGCQKGVSEAFGEYAIVELPRQGVPLPPGILVTEVLPLGVGLTVLGWGRAVATTVAMPCPRSDPAT